MPAVSNNPNSHFMLRIRRTERSMRSMLIVPSCTNSTKASLNSRSNGTMLISIPASMPMRVASLLSSATMCRV